MELNLHQMGFSSQVSAPEKLASSGDPLSTATKPTRQIVGLEIHNAIVVSHRKQWMLDRLPTLPGPP